jgi:CDGSH-type Zn-finger protein
MKLRRRQVRLSSVVSGKSEISGPKTVAWCACKHSKASPFCDGTHKGCEAAHACAIEASQDLRLNKSAVSARLSTEDRPFPGSRSCAFHCRAIFHRQAA